PGAIAEMAGRRGGVAAQTVRFAGAVDELIAQEGATTTAPVGVEQVHEPRAEHQAQREEARLRRRTLPHPWLHRAPPSSSDDAGAGRRARSRASSSRTSSSVVWRKSSYQVPTA